MDLKQLNEWVDTTEGKAWLDGQKAGLLAKRDELLTSQKTANGRIAELERRLGDAEAGASDADAFIRRTVADAEIERLLADAGVFDAFLPSAKKAVQDTYGVRVKVADGNFTACGTIRDADGTGTEAGLGDIVKDWTKQPGSRQFIMCRNSGGGASGSGHTSLPPTKLQAYSGRQLAAMSDADFANARNNELRRQQ